MGAQKWAQARDDNRFIDRMLDASMDKLQKWELQFKASSV
jgi:hypothetical protein